MNPRKPELAISRMRELMKQYDRVEEDMREATTSSKLAQLEREGGLVVQEICLVAPRIHEAMMQTSRQRRHDLSHGVVEKPVEERELTDEEKKEKERLLALLSEAKEKFSKAMAIDKNTGKEYRVLYLELHPYGPDFPETIVTISLRNEDTEIMFKNDEIKDLIDNFEAAPIDNMEPITESKPKKTTKKKTTKKKTAKKAEK